jgi:predicted tellurium resistance membrane protein TerC
MEHIASRDDTDDAKRAARVRYRQTEHFKKWERLERGQARKFRSSVEACKPVFDCLRMIAISATIFGLACAAQFSQPMNELCEIPLSLVAAILGFIGLVAAAMTVKPIAHWATMEAATVMKDNLAPYSDCSGAVGAAILVGHGLAFTLAYSLADQLVSRVPVAACIGPLP